MRLFEGAIGPTRLAQATATACLDSQQRLAFDCHLEPAQARQTGHVKLSGSLPLTFTNQPSPVVPHLLTHACPHSFALLFMHASTHPPVHPFIRLAGLSIHPFIYPSIRPTVCTLVRPSVRLSVHWSICPSIHSSIHSSMHSFMRSLHVFI